jgi:hypothetical protein
MPPDRKDETEWFEESGPWRGHWREDRAPISWPTHALESREFWETIEYCLSQLPQQMSIAFTLREIDGLTSTEICQILNVTPSNLGVLHRGRNKLRHLLEVEWFQKHRPAPPPKSKRTNPYTAEERNLRNMSNRLKTMLLVLIVAGSTSRNGGWIGPGSVLSTTTRSLP